jgi:predicted transcriptional regulator
MNKEPWTDDRSMEGRLEIRLDPELKRELDAYAKKVKLRISAVARNAIVEYLKKKNREDKREK